MAIGKRLLVFSPRDPKATALLASTAEWGGHVTVAETADELRAKLEAGEFDLVVIEDSKSLKKLVAEADPTGDLPRASLAEMEKRHILRVLNHSAGNKTRTSKILGIDTKTLYNKLKSYNASAGRRIHQQTQQQQNGG